MGLLYLAGARGILLLALAFVVSALASYVLLSKQREAMSGALNRRLNRVGPQRRRVPQRLEEGAAAEDDTEQAEDDTEQVVPGVDDRPRPGTGTSRPVPASRRG